MAHRQSAKEYGVNQTEDRRIHSDTQRKREHGDSAESRTLAQHAHGIARILEQRLSQVCPALLPDVFLRLLHAAELDQGAAPRFTEGHSGSYVDLNLLLHMKADFIFKLQFRFLPAEWPHQRREPGLKECHGRLLLSFLLFQYQSDRGRELLPLAQLFCQLPLARSRQGVELG